MKADEFWKMAEPLMKEHLPTWNLVTNKNKSRMGVCKYKEKVIGISAYHIVSGTEEEVKDTLIHEIAHALVEARSGHNWKWKAKYRELGGVGGRCASESVSKKATDLMPPKYVYVCQTCGNESKAFRKWKRKKACYKCCNEYSNGKYDHRFEMVEKTII